MSDSAHDARGGWSRAWWGLLIVCTAVVSLFDTLLLWHGSGYLTSGFNTESLGSAGELLVFVVASLVLDLVLILGIWALVVPLLRRAPCSPLQVYFLAAVVGAGLPIAIAGARFNVYSIVGNMFDLALMSQVGSATWSAMVIEAVSGARLLWGGVALAGLASVASIAVLLGRFERHRGPVLARGPRVAGMLVLLGIGLALALPVLLIADPLLLRLRIGLARKPSAMLLMAAVHRAADFDGDGYDRFTHPPDGAPWQASAHPYALDLPGNGVDENGVGGDLPGLAGLPAALGPARPLSTQPHVLLLFLESFRADLLERELDGQPITPFLNHLAREGTSSAHAWTHSPWTLSSRSQLFSGRLHSDPGDSTLIDDFKSWGYTVAYFSGQDESYGDSERILGTGRADVFYDAREDAERRTSRSTASVSLQVSWRTLLERVEEGLGRVDLDRPLFLYVNLVDTHFPYHHDEIDDLLGVAPLSRREIRSHRAERVFRAYANTAANVDRAARRLVESWRRRIGDADHAILVLADHGQAFYEEGRLGHGQSIGPEESRIPFIVWGIGGRWPEPIGPSDVRGLLRHNLDAGRGGRPPRARFVPDRDRTLLQYVSRLDRPREIALRGVDGAWAYDFGRDRFEWAAPDGARTEIDREREAARFASLVWRWETLVWVASGSGGDAAGLERAPMGPFGEGAPLSGDP